MSQMLDNSSPHLSFLAPEPLTTGVIVNPFDFAAHFAKPPVNMTFFSVEPHCKTPIDQHQVEECWIILSGNGELEYENISYSVKKYDAFYFASYKKHTAANTGTETLLILSLYW